jgi:AcrR family transcriptional regulator
MAAESLSSDDTPAEPARERLLAALADSIKRNGFRETTVADVVRIARTSRRTFYEHFADREQAYLALFEQVTQETMDRIAAAVDTHGAWGQQVERALDAYIDGVCAEPELQQSFVRELPGLGGDGAERQRVVIERYAALLIGLVETARQDQPDLKLAPLSRDVAIIVVGGLRELLVIAIQEGRDLHELRDSAAQVAMAILASSRPARG